MKATEAKLLDFIRKSPQFEIPMYQRSYSWTEDECQQLWDDIMRVGGDEEQAVHFVGSVVYIESGLYQVSTSDPLLVIDGQQRLTTVTLLLVALERALRAWGGEEPFDGFSPTKIQNRYLVNPDEDGARRQKLILSQTDHTTMSAVIAGAPLPPETSIRVEQNLALFERLLAENKARVVDVCRGLAKLVVVDVALTRGQDSPQLIFESMNSTGRELSQADLIRNFVLMGLEQQLQTSLYEQYWRPMELEFGQDGYRESFDQFMRNYLTTKTGEIPRIGDVYLAFKKHAKQAAIEAAGVEALVDDLRQFAHHYCAMALGNETNPALRDAFADLRELKVDVAYPLLLDLYHDYSNGILSAEQFTTMVRLIEAYVFRRAVCAIPTNSMNNTFAQFLAKIDKEAYVESFTAQLLLLPSYRRFPSNEEFVRDIKVKDLYHFRKSSYWLRRLENHGRKESVNAGEYTIEHILPQNQDLRPEWREALGEDWQRVQEQWLQTLGNLTLTGYNSEYSDKPFAAKRDMHGGFKMSPLQLNAGLGLLESWNESEIVARADRLANLALEVWVAPTLSAEILSSYQPEPVAIASGYTIADHPKLLAEPLASLYQAFRSEVLALDPCVREEFLKLYVAFKAETNFVDIVPRSNLLRLTINLKFPEVIDPDSHCRDVTNVGTWGNGDVEIELRSLKELPYAMGIIRQSFERQMGGTEE
jgi:uncharacterized protein with ParB-like and HNH nuclease domain/predicted transport protein